MRRSFYGRHTYFTTLPSISSFVFVFFFLKKLKCFERTFSRIQIRMMLSVKQFMGWVISQSWIKCPQKEAKYVQTSLVIHGEVGREIWDLDTREHCQIGLTRKHAQWVKRSCLLLDLPWTHRTSMHETWQKYMYNAAIEMLHIQRLFLERFTATACVHWHSQQKQCLGTKDILQPKWAPSIPLSCKRFLPPPPSPPDWPKTAFMSVKVLVGLMPIGTATVSAKQCKDALLFTILAFFQSLLVIRIHWFVADLNGLFAVHMTEDIGICWSHKYDVSFLPPHHIPGGFSTVVGLGVVSIPRACKKYRSSDSFLQTFLVPHNFDVHSFCLFPLHWEWRVLFENEDMHVSDKQARIQDFGQGSEQIQNSSRALHGGPYFKPQCSPKRKFCRKVIPWFCF